MTISFKNETNCSHCYIAPTTFSFSHCTFFLHNAACVIGIQCLQKKLAENHFTLYNKLQSELSILDYPTFIINYYAFKIGFVSFYMSITISRFWLTITSNSELLEMWRKSFIDRQTYIHVMQVWAYIHKTNWINIAEIFERKSINRCYFSALFPQTYISDFYLF